MNALEHFERECEVRGQQFGLTVLAPDGRAGVIIESRWDDDGTEDGCLMLRLKPPGAPNPRLVKADGKPSTRAFGIMTAAELDSAREAGGECCWWEPAVECRMPVLQPVWT